jgi:hypothetical protein
MNLRGVSQAHLHGATGMDCSDTSAFVHLRQVVCSRDLMSTERQPDPFGRSQ